MSERAAGDLRANLASIAPGEPVDGVCRPGHLGDPLDAWADALAAREVDRVVCLLSAPEAIRWGLPRAYADRFEVAHAPIRDRHLPDEATLTAALDAIRVTAADGGGRVAVHCNAGLGRTGIVSAAWLARERGYAPTEAIETVERAGRAPREAIRCGNATEAELLDLLGR